MFLTTVLRRERKKLKVCNLILIHGGSKKVIWFPRLSGVSIATSLSGSTWDFAKLLFLMFPYD